MATATTLGRKRDRASGTTARRRVAGGLGITKHGRPLHERVEIEVIPPLFDFSLGHLEHTKAASRRPLQRAEFDRRSRTRRRTVTR